jgi:hypothetical protein
VDSSRRVALACLFGLGCGVSTAPEGSTETEAADAPAASAAGHDAGAGSPEPRLPLLDAADGPAPDVEDAALEPPQEGGLRLEAGVSGDAGALDASVAQPAHDAQPTHDAPPDSGHPPQSPTAVYRVERYIGGLDHLIIQKEDAERGYCVTLRISSPSSGPGRHPIALPPSWALVGIWAVEGASCELSSGPMPPVTREPVLAEGRIAFREVSMRGEVCSLDLDVALTFMAGGAVPERDHLLATNLAAPCQR